LTPYVLRSVEDAERVTRLEAERHKTVDSKLRRERVWRNAVGTDFTRRRGHLKRRWLDRFMETRKTSRERYLPECQPAGAQPSQPDVSETRPVIGTPVEKTTAIGKATPIKKAAPIRKAPPIKKAAPVETMRPMERIADE